jgi:hypothetical protein
VLLDILPTILFRLCSGDAKKRILNSKVDLYLLKMIEERIFDGTIGREGIDILAEICKNGLAIWYFWGLWGSYELYS